MKKLLTPVMGIFAMLGVLVTTAEAATVSLIPGSTLTSVGATVTLSIEGSGFTDNTDGGTFTTTWDPAILQLASFTIANPPWDVSFVTDSDPNDGLLDSVFLATSPIGGAGPDFLIGTLTFDVVGDGSTLVSMTDDPLFGGWVAPGAVPIAVTYQGATVSTVPVPAAVWLFGSGLLGLVGIARRKAA
ncbi:MAG: VPLPA-CTERM sorting domain-containing protein [Thiogranum sp.]